MRSCYSYTELPIRHGAPFDSRGTGVVLRESSTGSSGHSRGATRRVTKDIEYIIRSVGQDIRTIGDRAEHYAVELTVLRPAVLARTINVLVTHVRTQGVRFRDVRIGSAELIDTHTGGVERNLVLA